MTILYVLVGKAQCNIQTCNLPWLQHLHPTCRNHEGTAGCPQCKTYPRAEETIFYILRVVVINNKKCAIENGHEINAFNLVWNFAVHFSKIASPKCPSVLFSASLYNIDQQMTTCSLKLYSFPLH